MAAWSNRLFVIMASAAPLAVILRRGPTDWYHIIRWRTATDKFWIIRNLRAYAVAWANIQGLGKTKTAAPLTSKFALTV